MAGNRWRGSRHNARILRGEGPGKTDSLYHNVGRRQQKGCGVSLSRTRGRQVHLGATVLTAIVSPFKVPVTVAFLPACLSSVARAILSEVSKM
jgi:hypothetical protein